MTKSIQAYISKLPDWQQEIAGQLQEIILQAEPELVAAIKWGQPVFECGGPVCYFKGYKNHLTFGFWRGVALMPIDGRLESSGEKMAHIKFVQGAALEKGKLKKLVKQGVELNRTLGNPNTQRGKK